LVWATAGTAGRTASTSRATTLLLIHRDMATSFRNGEDCDRSLERITSLHRRTTPEKRRFTGESGSRNVYWD
jgi:hypothetical protein